jgi:hypothetical protein
VVGRVLLQPNTGAFRDVWIGALRFLWRAGFALFSTVNDVSRFSIHGSIAAVVMFPVGSTRRRILLYGVEYTAAYAQMRRARFDDPSR